MAERAIEYRHAPLLGGFRKPRPDSINSGWQQPAFRAYADYMSTAEFTGALGELEALAGAGTTSIMCAEAQWWRCHRRLIADALMVQGWDVRHLGLHADPVPHALTAFAIVGPEGKLTYPSAQGELL